MVMSKVLIIDDDEELCELVSEYLGVEGFVTEVVNDGASGLEAARSGKYDMAILDVMLPKMNGFEVLKNLRTDSSLPVLMLTARDTVADRVIARRTWEEGSDRDYTVAGRHSPRYYQFATRWMVSEVALHRQRHTGRRSYPRLAKTFFNARLGRLGMMLTAHEVER